MQQDQHRLTSHLRLVQPGCTCEARLEELERQLEQQGQQLAALLQMFLDLKGEPR